MKHIIKAFLLASTACLVSTPAIAQTSTLESRILALEAMVAQLKSELASEKASTDADIIKIEKTMRDAPVSVKTGTSSNGFMVGDTTFTLGGFVDFDAHLSNYSDGSGFAGGSVVRDFYIPGATPVGDGSGGVSQTDFTAEATRFSVKAQNGGVTGYLETDFLLSGQGNERVSNSFSPRLRRAYVDYNGWRIGQEWSTFQNTSAIPESASFLGLSDGMVFGRQAMVRYTNGPFQIALENGNTTVTNTAAGGGRIEADGNTIPDLVARYNMKGDFGNVSLAAIGRQLQIDNNVLDASTTGWGLSASGRLNAGPGDIRFGLTGGEGLGRYIGLNTANGAAINPANGDLEAIPSYGGHVSYRYPFGDTSLSFGYSGLFIDNPAFVMANGVNPTESVQSGLFAITHKVAPKTSIGVEALLGMRELEDGTDGELTRFTFSTKYGF